MSKGGAREGAGRKKGETALAAERGRALLSKMLEKELEPIAKVLIAKAKKGDIQAFKELCDRSWGKAAQAMEIKGDDGGPIVITWLDPQE